MRRRGRAEARAERRRTLAFAEKCATEAYAKFDEAVEINRYDDETLAKVQEMASEVIVETACANPNSAKVYVSMLDYLNDYAKWRDASAPFNLGRTPNGPDVQKIKDCM